MTLIVTVGFLPFYGKYHAVRDGFYIQDFDGWEDGVVMRRNSHPFPQNHGGFDVPSFMDERKVEMSGLCYAKSWAVIGYRALMFTGALSKGTLSPVTVEQDDNVLRGQAQLGDHQQPTFKRVHGGRPLAKFEMPMTFPDPRKYGDTLTYGPGTSVTAWQYGNFSATPIYTVTGSMPDGYSIFGPEGREYRVNLALTTGHTHTINMATGALRVDGVLVFGKVTRDDTWACPSGVKTTATLTPVSGTGLIAAAVRETNS